MAFLKDLIVLGASRFIGDAQGSKFIVDGATSSLFLKGDGTLDSNTYLTLTDLVLPDWDQTDTTSKDYIKNKPEIPNDYLVDYSKQYLTFEALENGTFQFTNTINYSIDGGTTWVALAANTATPTITAGNRIIWKATLTPSSSNPIGIGTFSSTGNFNVEGNAMSLLFEDNFIGQTDLTGKDYAFYSLFNACIKLINAKNLSLPATTLAERCYQYMFYGCTGLTSAPELPATTLAERCYISMFSDCTALVTAPSILPAITLTIYCYYNMFNGCTALVTAPELPATTLAVCCYQAMFSNCTALVTAPKLPATALVSYCYQQMFLNCTALSTAPELPATTLANTCYQTMFKGCTSLTTAPELPATTLVSSCYSHMFFGCSNLNYIKAMFITTPGVSYTNDWVNGVAASGTFIKNNNATWNVTDANSIPTGWNVYTDIEYEVVRYYELVDQVEEISEKEEVIAAALTELDQRIDAIPDPIKPDWNAPSGSPAEILNKPIIPSNEPIDYSSQYLTFVALEDGTFTLTIGSGIGTTLLTSVSYSTDDGETWTTTNNQDSTTIVITTPTITKGNKVLWKGTGTAMSTVTKDTASADRPTYASIFSSSGNFDAEGNIMSLLFGDNFSTVTSFAENSSSNFAALFYSYNISTVAKIVNTNNLLLPATTLTSWCYCYIFQGCSTLKTPPELPAMTMAEGCYRNIFTRCTNLTTAPELPATTLADYCYMSLFYGCKSLKEAPKLPATTMTIYCYEYMFMDCSSLVIAPELPATTLAVECYCQMFKDCSSLTTAPELSATTLAEACYCGMFLNCSRLTAVPELPATTLANRCYDGMFGYCTSLTVLPNKLLPATTLTEKCYYCMFEYCSSLITVPELPATTLASYCYAGMFQYCYSLVIVPSILPATTLAEYCYYGIFKNCTALTIAPELPAITLVSNCYRQLFNGCTSLNYIKALFTTTPGTSYTNTWVSGVASTGTFVKSQDAQWSVTGNNGIPTNWNTYINDEYEVVRHYELDNLVSSIESILLSI